MVGRTERSLAIPEIAEWSGWRDRMPAERVEGMSPRFTRSLDRIASDRGELAGVNVLEDRLAVVLSAYDAGHLLPSTIRELSAQMAGDGLSGEIFVSLNNGGGDTAETFTADRTAQHFGVDRIVFGATRPAAVAAGTTSGDPSDPDVVELSEPIVGTDNGITLVVIRQSVDDERNAGKIRALRDVYEFLFQQCLVNRYNPRYLLAVDAETRLRQVETERRSVVAADPQGLATLIERSLEGRVHVSASTLMVPFDADGNPVIGAAVHPVMAPIDLIHGTVNYQYLAGGATLGRFDDIVCIMRELATYPGLRTEDILLSVTAEILGRAPQVVPEVVHLNRTAEWSWRRPGTGFAQMLRWQRGITAIRREVGSHALEAVMEQSTWFCVRIVLRYKFREHWGRFSWPVALHMVVSYVAARMAATLTADDLGNGRGSW